MLSRCQLPFKSADITFLRARYAGDCAAKLPLSEPLRKASLVNNSSTPDGFSITRFLLAPVASVWDAWTEPDAMATWWHTRHSITPVEEIQADVQVGGHYRYTTINAETGHRVVTGGIYRTLDPPNRIAFTWDVPGAEPYETPLVVVTLEPDEQGTRLFFELRGASGAPGDHFYYDEWAQMLDSLATYLTTHHEGA